MRRRIRLHAFWVLAITMLLIEGASLEMIASGNEPLWGVASRENRSSIDAAGPVAGDRNASGLAPARSGAAPAGVPGGEPPAAPRRIRAPRRGSARERGLHAQASAPLGARFAGLLAVRRVPAASGVASQGTGIAFALQRPAGRGGRGPIGPPGLLADPADRGTRSAGPTATAVPVPAAAWAVLPLAAAALALRSRRRAV